MVLNRINDTLTKFKERPSYSYWLLAAITLLAAALRFYKLGVWGFWIDEIFTINHAQQHFGSLRLLLDHIPPARNWIPVSIILTAQTLNLFGISEGSARLVSAIIGTLSIPILYFPVRKMFGVQVALIAVLLLAVSTWHIEWSQNARFYTALMLFYTLALICYFYGIERNRPFYIFIGMFLLYFATSERLFAASLIPVVVVYLLALKVLPFEKPPGLNTRNLLLTLLPVIAAILIEIISFITNGTSRFFGDFDWFFQFNIDDPLRLLSFIAFDIGIPLMCFSAFSSIYLILNKNRTGLLLLISAAVPVVLLLALNPFIFTKTRYIFMTLPSWIILGAVGIKEVITMTKSQGRILALGLLFVFLADFTGSNLLYFQVNKGNRHDWKGAFSIVKQHRLVDDEVVTSWPQWEGFYWDKEIIIWESIDPEFIESSGKRFWFILDEEIVWGNMETKNWLERNAELVDVLYLRRENEYYLKIYLYDPAPNIRGMDLSGEFNYLKPRTISQLVR